MIRQNLFPVGAMIRFGTATRVTATSLSGDFFLRYRVTSSFFSLVSSIAVKSYNPLEIRSGKTEGEQEEGKRNLTGELGEHQGVQKFSIRLSRELRMTLVHNEETSIMSTRWMSTSIFPPSFFFLQHTCAIYTCHSQGIAENFIVKFSRFLLSRN